MGKHVLSNGGTWRPDTGVGMEVFLNKGTRRETWKGQAQPGWGRGRAGGGGKRGPFQTDAVVLKTKRKGNHVGEGGENIAFIGGNSLKVPGEDGAKMKGKGGTGTGWGGGGRGGEGQRQEKSFEVCWVCPTHDTRKEHRRQRSVSCDTL